jgi:hypothetical protein
MIEASTLPFVHGVHHVSDLDSNIEIGASSSRKSSSNAYPLLNLVASMAFTSLALPTQEYGGKMLP